VCRFYEAARIFNAYVGLEIQTVTSTQVPESQDYNALWLWVKAHRAEVATLAEAQLCRRSLGFSVSFQSPSLDVPEKTPDKPSGIGLLKTSLQCAPTSDTSSPPKCSVHDVLTPTTFQTPPTQLPVLPVSSPTLALSPACQCEFEALFFSHSTHSPTSLCNVIPFQ